MKHLNTLKPYLVNAFYTWAIDVNKTPLIEIAPYHKNILPEDLKNKENIVINIHPNAILNMILSKENMKFETIFLDENFNVTIYYESIRQIFCKEDTYGLEFEIETKEPKGTRDTKRHLYLVKNEK